MAKKVTGGSFLGFPISAGSTVRSQVNQWSWGWQYQFGIRLLNYCGINVPLN